MGELIDRKLPVLVIVHRAAAPGCSENSLAGIRAAGEFGVDVVEVDVRRTVDGVPVLLHDRTLGRTSHGHGPVWILPARWVGRRRLRGGERRVPTLEAGLDALPDGVEIGIHVKDRRALGATLGVVERRGFGEKTWLWLERPRDVGIARGRLPGVRVTLLNDWGRVRLIERYLATAEAAAATAVSIPWGRVVPELTAAAHRRGLLVFAKERNPDELLGKVAAGLDGVITDEPARAAAELGR